MDVVGGGGGGWSRMILVLSLSFKLNNKLELQAEQLTLYSTQLKLML